MISSTSSLARSEPADAAAASSRHTDRDRSLSESTRQRILDSVPANTSRAYRRQWSAFTSWCAETGRTPLPATGETLAEYVAALADVGRAPATIEQAIAAVRAAHRTAGHHTQPDTEGARRVLRRHRRGRAEVGQRARQALPITIDALRLMIDGCDAATARGLRDRVALVLGLALMGRRSELVALDLPTSPRPMTGCWCSSAPARPTRTPKGSRWPSRTANTPTPTRCD